MSKKAKKKKNHTNSRTSSRKRIPALVALHEEKRGQASPQPSPYLHLLFYSILISDLEENELWISFTSTKRGQEKKKKKSPPSL